MAIDSIPNALFFAPTQNTQTSQSKKKEKIEKIAKTSFARVFSEAEKEVQNLVSNEVLIKIEGLSTEDALQVLLAQVEERGSDLRNNTTPENLKKYKDSVQAFLHFVVKNTYEVSKNTTKRRNIEKTTYTVQEVDKKLSQLARDILSGQRRNLAILEKVNEIKGLLVDLML